MCNCEITLKGPGLDLHSGLFGGSALNPINVIGKMPHHRLSQITQMRHKPRHALGQTQGVVRDEHFIFRQFAKADHGRRL